MEGLHKAETLTELGLEKAWNIAEEKNIPKVIFINEIDEEEVPLADVPATGDMTLVWAAASAVSAAGLFLVGKKSKDEE